MKIEITDKELDSIECGMVNFIQTVKPWVKNVQLNSSDWKSLVKDSFRDLILKFEEVREKKDGRE